MVVKGIVSAIYAEAKKISVILPEYDNMTTKPLAIYGKTDIDSFKVNDFVAVIVFNNDFNDAMILSESSVSSGGGGGDVVIDVIIDETLSVKGQAADAKATGDRLSRLEDLLYEAISITSFTTTPASAEIGSTVASVVLKWGINKIPAKLTLDGAAIDTSLTSKTVSDLALTYTENKTWTLKATDEREAASTKTASVKFYNGVYYGSISADATIDNAAILALGKSIRGSRAGSFKTTQDSQRGIFVCPVSYGNPMFKIGEGTYTWEKVNSEPFLLTNQHGYINPNGYNIWRSFQNCGAKDTVITVL